VILLAHRGLWWPDVTIQNRQPAFHAASDAGFGVELDVRSHKDSFGIVEGRVFVHHDPLFGDSHQYADDEHGWQIPFLKDAAVWLAERKCPLVAVNIKDEALRPEDLVGALDASGLLARAFFFDQPPTYSAQLRAVHLDVRTLARASDRGEPLEAALRSPDWGVWLDQFDSDCWTAVDIERVHAAGKTAWVVSPELHRRTLDLRRALGEWSSADGVCTDLPHLYVAALARQPELFPDDPWWLAVPADAITREIEWQAAHRST
jgi:hypothetical protein